MLKTDSMRTPLGLVRGLGSAKSGLSHWWHQRLTAIAMLGLVSWMCFLVVSLTGSDYTMVVSVISHPVNAAIMILFITVGFWHAALGLQTVFEDYISHEGVRLAAIVMVRMVLVLLATISVISVLKLAI